MAVLDRDEPATGDGLMLRLAGAWSQKVADADVQRHVQPNRGNQEQ
jgi:hypothetical protein